MTSASKTPRRNRLTLEQKLAVCQYAKKIRAKTNLSNGALALWATRTFDLRKPLSRDTARRIIDREVEWTVVPPPQQARKVALGSRHRDTDARIMAVFVEMEGVVEAITGDVIRATAVRVKAYGDASQPKFSNGWLYRLQKRNGISMKRKHGEADSVDQGKAEEGRTKIRKLPDPNARSEIYNMDETAFFFRSDANTTLTQKKKVSGCKDPKNRMTMALTVNADGSDKLPPLYIGSAVVPRPLKGHNVREELGVNYTKSPKAWMNSSIFSSWLTEVNHKMRFEGRQILLLVDNVSSHVQPKIPMSNVRLEFLPKNTTSCLQPLDQAIIRATKSKYTQLKVMDSVDRFFERHPQEKVDIYTALRWSKMAFDDVSQKTIQNCWRHAGILSDRSKISSIFN